jgi:hypothetical protein
VDASQRGAKHHRASESTTKRLFLRIESAVRKPDAIEWNFISLFALSAWCGLIAGLLEVATIVVRKEFFDANRLYGMSRHFVWLIPLTNLLLFLVLGISSWFAGLIWPRRGRDLRLVVMVAIMLLPPALIAFPRIYPVALVFVALGVAARVVPLIQKHARGFSRFVRWSLPVAGLIVLMLAASLWVGDHVRESRERARALPAPGSPNVLLIVLDTVAARHLSLYGYERPTSTTLLELADRGIRFDGARSPSSWTLPSHATMFTGRWLHELSVGWLHPLDNLHPTLAEYLGKHGYATAGFVGNTMFCASDTGLNRGFTHYEDFAFPRLTAFKTAILVHQALGLFGKILPVVEARPSLEWLRRHVQEIWLSFVFDRKGADVINRGLLNWLSRRPVRTSRRSTAARRLNRSTIT